MNDELLALAERVSKVPSYTSDDFCGVIPILHRYGNSAVDENASVILIGAEFRDHIVTALRLAAGEATKSDGGVEGNAIAGLNDPTCKTMPGVTVAPGAGIKPGPSDTRPADVTVGEALAEDTSIGGITWHSSEEDGGPDVGISVYLGPDDRLWCGEISRNLFEEHDGPTRFDNDMGAFIVRFTGKETTLIAKCADHDVGREFIEQFAALARMAALLDTYKIGAK